MASEKELVVLTFLCLLLSASATTELYVRPATTPESNCPSDPCKTLNEYARSGSIFSLSDTTFILMEGEHVLDSTIALENITNITFRGSGRESTRVIMTSGTTLSWRHSSEIVFSSLEITYQALVPHTSDSLFVFQESHSIQILNVIFTGIINQPNRKRVIYFTQCEEVEVSNCTFLNGHSDDTGAAIKAADSTFITFSGTNVFSNNTAVAGGAIRASNHSHLVFTGRNYFIMNRAITDIRDLSTGGGAVNLRESSMDASGLSVFKNNGPIDNAYLSGGAMVAHNSTLTIRGQAEFSGNSGTYAGVLNAFNSTILLQGRITLDSNQNAGCISVFTSNFSIIGEVNCTNSEIVVETGFGPCFYSENSTLYVSGTVNLINNRARNGAAGAFFTFNSSTLIEGDINFIGNRAETIGGALAIDRSFLQLDGNITFFNNSAAERGGGMYAIDSTVTFSGSSTFIKNSAFSGGGMGLDGTTQLDLSSPVEMTFDRNHAEAYGGALLFLDSNSIAQCQNVTVEPRVCFFRIEGASNISDMDTYFNFTQNTAGAAGTVLHGGSLQLCRVQVNNKLIREDSFEFLESISIFDLSDGKSSDISSDPLRVCFCEDGVINCSLDYIRTVHTKRGELFTMSVITVGQGDYPVPSTIRAYVRNGDNQTELSPQSHSVGQTCTDVSFRLLSTGINKTVVLYPDGPCGNTVNTRRKIRVIIQPCPPGFRQQGTRCECEERLQELDGGSECDIDTALIRRPGNTWLKPIFDANLTYLGFAVNRNCPLGFCRSSYERIVLNLAYNDSDIICSSNRTGILCGNCRQNYSLTFNDYECKVCGNEFLFLLIFFTFAGIALIAVLLTLHMTVAAGTINGLILYANIVNINHLIFFPNDETNILSIFIAWVNLDFGIETCFYDGLDFYAFAWLQYVFPLYLWFLIGAIILVNKLSRRVGRLFGTNPVAVLATIILMSFTKLMQTVIIALAYTELEYPDGTTNKVWLFDANVTYFKGKHAVLATVAIFVIAFLLLPYIFFLLFGYRLQAYSSKKAFRWFNKLKPFLDAYYAPYNNKTRYWTGLMLVIRSALYLVFAFNTLTNSSANLVTISSVFTAVALLPWLSSRIYDKFYLDLIEASFILNICILATATYHVRSTGGNQAIVTCLSIGVAFVEFWGIVAFHIVKRMKKLKTNFIAKYGGALQNKWIEIKRKLKGSKEKIPGVEGEESRQQLPRPPTHSIIHLRESLLEDDL